MQWYAVSFEIFFACTHGTAGRHGYEMGVHVSGAKVIVFGGAAPFGEILVYRYGEFVQSSVHVVFPKSSSVNRVVTHYWS
jgi:hypothetical protein